MIIKPWGYSLWENIQKDLDRRFKETGHQNAYFPLFIPLHFFEKEAEHVEGFAKECAVVTHHRLEPDGKGRLKPGGKLEEPLVVRPTSETIIGEAFSRWINSYRDLPVLINQWANIVRWEMRTRLFLRTSEFLWQEGHTAHASKEEALEETRRMHGVYKEFCENFLAIPVVAGEKTAHERFPGALNTFSIEAMMQDGKALQAGTSHFLGQNFSRAQQIVFQNEDNEEVHAWTTSWGVSTRLIGALIMAHGDDNGLRLPPKVSPLQIIIIPICPQEKDRQDINDYVENLRKKLDGCFYNDEKIRIDIDRRDLRGGEKNWSWIKKGVPLRVEIGPKDLAGGKVCFSRRDQDPRDKIFLDLEEFVKKVPEILEDIQNQLFQDALDFRKKHSASFNDKASFLDFFKTKNEAGFPGGFAWAPSCLDETCEKQINRDLSVSVRCLGEQMPAEESSCIYCTRKAKAQVLFARAY
jgi:prolyl-tRNA synthetase